MKKFIFSLVMALMTVISVNAQSFQLHQSYNDDNSTWGSTRFITDYFWTSPNEKVNVFSWNSFSKNGISALLYGEYQIGKSNFYAHGEVRAQMGNFDYETVTPEVGFAYLIPWNNGPAIYVTPKYVYNDVYFSKHDIEVSINSSYENDKVYYEGYIDTNWIKGASLFTEQKAYYKLTKNFQIGACVVGRVGKEYNGGEVDSNVQPYLSVRVAL